MFFFELLLRAETTYTKALVAKFSARNPLCDFQAQGMQRLGWFWNREFGYKVKDCFGNPLLRIACLRRHVQVFKRLRG